MTIAIDANEANVPQRVGIGEYCFNLLHGLYRLTTTHNFVILTKEKVNNDFPQARNNWKYEVVTPRKLWTQFALPLKLFTDKTIDLIFSPSHYAPRLSRVPRVISIMDLSYLNYPQMFKAKDLLQLKSWSGYSINKAVKVITISNYSKESIVSYYGKDPNSVHVTYPGIDTQIYHPNYTQEEVELVKQKYRLNKYCLFVGTLQPRKNLLRLIEAFKIVRQSSPDIKLVLVGKKGWLFKEILTSINKHQDFVSYLGYLKDEDLAKLFVGASASVMPSLYEGFGLTVIESMACGCPVVCSNVTSLPEIAGNAGVFVDPQNIGNIAQGIAKVMNPEQKYLRIKLVKDGLIQAQKFSWATCSAKTLEVLESAAIHPDLIGV